MQFKEKLLIGVVIANLILLDVGTVVLLRRKSQVINNTAAPVYQTIVQQTATPAATLISNPTPTPIPAPKSVVVQPTTKPKARSVSYVTIPGSGGGTVQTSWVDVAGSDFYFDTADYPGLVEVYLEANMNLVNGSGMAYVQLLDVTHGIGVQGSDVKTNSNSATMMTSGKISFWRGKNLIRVQVKSLTSEQAVFNSGRLRVVTEN